MPRTGRTFQLLVTITPGEIPIRGAHSHMKFKTGGITSRSCSTSGILGVVVTRAAPSSCPTPSTARSNTAVVAARLMPDNLPLLYLDIDPPTHAIVLSVDEKSQIQALDRTLACLPMKKGPAASCAAARAPCAAVASTPRSPPIRHRWCRLHSEAHPADTAVE